MRVCLVFDCLYPYTVGGAERWYRGLAERLAAAGHTVTYLTLRQWDRDEEPDVGGVAVVPVGPRMNLYADGRRRLSAQAVFAAGVLAHLVRRRHVYDVVQTPALHLALLAVIAARTRARFRLVVDWFEVWTPDYWREYLGEALGRLGYAAQRMSARAPHRAFCFSRIHAERLREQGFRGRLALLEGIYAGPAEPPAPNTPDPVVVFAGRHIPEKRVTALVPAVALARQRVGDLRCTIYGDGPDRPKLLELISEQQLADVIEAPGFVDDATLSGALRRALCLALPSRREGYGLVVVEAAAAGTPSIVVNEPDNAAVELVEDGENGVVAASADPPELAAAILRVHDAGLKLRSATCAWFERNANRLSLESSLAVVLAAYSERQ